MWAHQVELRFYFHSQFRDIGESSLTGDLKRI